MSVAKSKIGDEISVTHEDQKMINSFANKNAKDNELKNIIENRKKTLQNLEDASDELMMLDDVLDVPVQIGEVFLRMSPDDAQAYIDQSKEEIEKEIVSFDEQIKNCVKENGKV